MSFISAILKTEQLCQYNCVYTRGFYWHSYVSQGSHFFTPLMNIAMLAEVCGVDLAQLLKIKWYCRFRKIQPFKNPQCRQVLRRRALKQLACSYTPSWHLSEDTSLFSGFSAFFLSKLVSSSYDCEENLQNVTVGHIYTLSATAAQLRHHTTPLWCPSWHTSYRNRRVFLLL